MEDLDGTALYAVLGILPAATGPEIKKAYRDLARRHHPDKGGDSIIFGKIQHAYEVLSDRKRRQVYDTWAKELQFRYVRPATGGPMGGEDVLLDEFESLGLKCDPATQLVVTCEVCRRPATKQCWTCGMDICEFCTLKRHWKDGVPLHWPLINSNHMAEKLAQRELEKKRIDDAKRLALEDPHYRSERELRDIRSFKQVAQELLKREDRKRLYDLRLARFYMWAQTEAYVFIACMIPTGYSDKELVVECDGTSLLVQSEGSPALIDRQLAYSIDYNRPLETMKTEDNRICTIALPKSEVGSRWTKLFHGDPDGVRCMVQPYTLFESDDDVSLHFELPFWIDPEDVMVKFTEHQVRVHVRNTMDVRRTYWRNVEEEARRRDYRVVEVEECCWSLEEDTDVNGEKCKLLVLTLVRPPPTEEEVQFKKGRRQDNRAASRYGSLVADQGYRFFADDEDEFGLEDVLQALCFLESGVTYVPPKPWHRDQSALGIWVNTASALPPGPRSLLKRLKLRSG